MLLALPQSSHSLQLPQLRMWSATRPPTRADSQPSRPQRAGVNPRAVLQALVRRASLCSTDALRRQCPQCHEDASTDKPHPLAKTTEMTFLCKKCKSTYQGPAARLTRAEAFRKDMTVYEESDEYCPNVRLASRRRCLPTSATITTSAAATAT